MTLRGKSFWWWATAVAVALVLVWLLGFLVLNATVGH
jgi:ABC-type phosphate transport system auxiliary subunit